MTYQILPAPGVAWVAYDSTPDDCLVEGSAAARQVAEHPNPQSFVDGPHRVVGWLVLTDLDGPPVHTSPIPEGHPCTGDPFVADTADEAFRLASDAVQDVVRAARNSVAGRRSA
jgi:hypothetical protein